MFHKIQLGVFFAILRVNFNLIYCSQSDYNAVCKCQYFVSLLEQRRDADVMPHLLRVIMQVGNVMWRHHTSHFIRHQSYTTLVTFDFIYSSYYAISSLLNEIL